MTSAASPPGDANPRPLPQTVSEQVSQCAEIIRLAASSEGGSGSSHRRQRIELLLPINQRRQDFNLTDRDDYGDNNDAVYKAAMETASAVIRLVDPNGWVLCATRHTRKQKCSETHELFMIRAQTHSCAARDFYNEYPYD